MRSRAIVLFSWVLLASIGLQLSRFASFEMRRFTVRSEVKYMLKAGVPENERTVFTLTRSQYDGLKWMKHGKEFSVGNSLFDVIDKKEQADGTIQLSCMNDRQEAALFADLSRLVEMALDNRGDGAQKAQLVFGVMKHWSVTTMSWRCSAQCIDTIGPRAWAASLLAGHFSVRSAPPRS